MAIRKSPSRKSAARKPAPRKAPVRKPKPKPRTPKPPGGTGRGLIDPRALNLNPYVAWACGPGKPLYFPPGVQDGEDKRLTLLLHVKGSAQAFVRRQSLAKKNAALQRDWRRTSFVIPFAGAPRLTGEAGTDWVIAFAPPPIATLLNTAGPESDILGVMLGRPVDDPSLCPSKSPACPRAAWPGSPSGFGSFPRQAGGGDRSSWA